MCVISCLLFRGNHVTEHALQNQFACDRNLHWSVGWREDQNAPVQHCVSLTTWALNASYCYTGLQFFNPKESSAVGSFLFSTRSIVDSFHCILTLFSCVRISWHVLWCLLLWSDIIVIWTNPQALFAIQQLTESIFFSYDVCFTSKSDMIS